MSILPTRFPAHRLLAVVIAAAFGLTACGRFGPLEPPPDANAPKPAAAANPAEGLSQAKPKIPPITAPNQPFILDPLVK